MTIDAFVILTPLLMLAVMSLLGFVGCDVVFGLKRPPLPDGPTGVIVTPGDQRVELSWDPYAGATQYTISRRTDVDPKEAIALNLPSNTSYLDSPLTNGTTYYYSVTVSLGGGSEPDSIGEFNATPMAVVGGLTKYVTGITLGTMQNSVTSFRGMAIRVGAAPISVRALGRAFAPGNSEAHVLKIVDKVTGLDVPNSSVTATMVPSSLGAFQYAALLAPVILNPGAVYFIVSSETAGGDLAYRQDTALTTTAVAVLEGSAFNQFVGGPYMQAGSPGTAIPLDFQYQ